MAGDDMKDILDRLITAAVIDCWLGLLVYACLKWLGGQL